MSNNNDIRGSIDLDATPAVRALSAAKKAFRDLSNATTDTTKKMTADQRAAANAVIANEAKIRAARDKTVANYRETLAKIRRLDLNAQNDRKISRQKANDGSAESAARVAGTEAKTELTVLKQQTEEVRKQGVLKESAAREALTLEKQHTEEIRQQAILMTAEGRAAESGSRQQLTKSKQITEELRQQILIQDAANRKESAAIRNQIALRRQVFREQEAAARAQDRKQQNISGMRYALYDVAGAAAAVGLAGVGAAVGITKIAVAWEKSFAEVARTSKVSSDDVGYLKAQFVNLVDTLPVSWEKLTEIGTLAGQLGIVKSEVADFTKVTAMFSATTGVSVEDTATAFGRLDALIPSVDGNYQGLAESILKVGTNSVATEGDIINITGQLASIAGPAGYSYDQIIGLSGALASVGAPPELSRGTIQRAFGKIGAAVSDGGIELDKWAKASGMSADEFRTQWNDDASGVFTKFMGKINEAGVGADAVLKELGITSVRDVPLLKKLAGAADNTGKSGTLLKTSLEQAADATGELQKQYAIISGTTGAKLQVLLQNILSTLDKIGSSNFGLLNDLITNVTTSVRDFSDSLNEPVRLFDMWNLDITNGELAGMGVVIAGVVGALGLLVAGIGRVAASTLAMRDVMGVMRGSFSKTSTTASGLATNISYLKGNVGGLAGRMSLASKATGVWNSASKGLHSALSKIGPELAVVAAFAGADYLLQLDKQSREAGTGADQMANKFIAAKDSLSLLKGIKVNQGGAWGNEDLKPFITDIDNLGKGLDHIGKGGMWNDFGETFKDLGRVGKEDSFANITTGLSKMDAGFEQLVGAGNVKVAKDQMQQLVSSAHLTDDQLSVLIERMPNYKRELTNTLNGHEMDATDANLRKAARGGVSEMTDALVEMAGVSKDAVTANFGGSSDAALQFMDSIDQGTESIYDMNAAYQSTLDRVNQKGKDAWVKAGNDVSDYTDIATVSLDDFLTTMDGQIVTAQKRFGNLAKIALRGGQDAAAEAAKYSPEIIDTIANGSDEGFQHWLDNLDLMSKDARSLVEANIAGLTPTVVADFKRLGGGSRDELIKALSEGTRTVDQILDDLRKDNAGKPIRLNTDTSKAAKDIADFKARQSGGKVDLEAALSTYDAARDLDRWIANNNWRVVHIQVNATNPNIGFGLGDGHATGGYISGPGTGTSDSIPARLSNGEFVFTAAAVRNIGVNNLYDLMRQAQRGFATGGYVAASSNSYVPSYGGSSGSRSGSTAGVTIVELSAYDRQLLAQAGNVQLRIGNKVVAQAANAANVVAKKRGSN